MIKTIFGENFRTLHPKVKTLILTSQRGKEVEKIYICVTSLMDAPITGFKIFLFTFVLRQATRMSLQWNEPFSDPNLLARAQ